MSKSSKIKYSMWIFGIRMWSIIENNDYIVNVNEAIFTKSVKQNYSRLPRGKRHPTVSQNWVGSSTVIHGLWLGGDWLWAIYQGSTTSQRFGLCLLILRENWTKTLKIDPCRIKVMWDNASVHVSKKTLKMAVFLDIPIYWLPQYSPSIAPVEWVFGAMKYIIACMKPQKKIDFSRRSGLDAIWKSLKALPPSKTAGLWRVFIREVKDVVISWVKSLKIANILQQEITEDKQKKLRNIYIQTLKWEESIVKEIITDNN